MITKLSLLFLLFSSVQLFGRDWPQEITSIFEISESKPDDQIWATFIDEKQVSWWLLYRGPSSKLIEHRNTISIFEEPLGEDSMVPMIPLSHEDEKKVLALIETYIEKAKNEDIDKIQILRKILELKEAQPNQAPQTTAASRRV